MSIDNPLNQYRDFIKETLQKQKLSSNFNDHSLKGEAFIETQDSLKDKSALITQKLIESQIAKKLVA